MPGFVPQHLMAIDYTVVALSLVGLIRSGGPFGILRQLQKILFYRSNIPISDIRYLDYYNSRHNSCETSVLPPVCAIFNDMPHTEVLYNARPMVCAS